MRAPSETERLKKRAAENSHQAGKPKTKSALEKRSRLFKPEQLAGLIENIPDAVVVLDKDWRVAHLNQRAVKMLGKRKPAGSPGTDIWTEYPHGAAQSFRLACEKAADEQLPVVSEYHDEAHERWYENRIYPAADSVLVLSVEITDRKRTDAILQARRFFLQKILDTEPGTIYIYDVKESRNVFINRHWLLNFGYAEDETQEMGDQLLARICHPDDLARVNAHYGHWQQAGEGEVRETEYRVRTKAGEWRWLHTHETVFARDAAGQAQQVLGITHDITDQKLAQEAFRQNQLELGLIYDTLVDGVFLLAVEQNERYQFLSVNQAFYRSTGLTSEQVLGRYADEIIPASSQALAFGNYRKARDERAPVTWEEVSEYPSGRKTAIVVVTAVYNAEDICTHLVGTVHDVTRRRRAEKALLESEEKFSKVFFASPVALSISRVSDGKYVEVNDSLARRMGYRRDEMVGHTAVELGLWEDHAARGRMLDVLRTKGSVRDFEMEFRTRSGEIGVGLISREIIQLGGEDHFIGTTLDITERKQAENALRTLNLELEQRIAARTDELAAAMLKAQESDRLKSAFLASMSHELRTPLNSIIGFTGVILQGLAGPLNEEQTRQLGMARESARHLLALINDVLDISKIEAGELEIVKQPFDMRQAIESALRVVQPLAQKKNLPLAVSIGPGVGSLDNDRRRVEQVLINLVNNAVKFAEHGEVEIVCQLRDGWLETSVRDHGIGIKPEDIGKLFKPFQQINTGLDRSHEGTGLGLSICRHLVTAMGGEITVASEWGRGSVFTFTLPA